MYCGTLYVQHSFNISSSLSWFLEPKSHLLWRLVLNPGCIWGEDSSLQSLRPVCWVHTSTLLVIAAAQAGVAPCTVTCIVVMGSLEWLHAWNKYLVHNLRSRWRLLWFYVSWILHLFRADKHKCHQLLRLVPSRTVSGSIRSHDCDNSRMVGWFQEAEI